MRAYKVTSDPADKGAYFVRRAQAARSAKDQGPHIRDAMRIEHVEFKTDQATLCEILSGWGCELKVLRTWRLSLRGGLVECANGE